MDRPTSPSSSATSTEEEANVSDVSERTESGGYVAVESLFDFPGEASTVTETVSEAWEQPGFAFEIDTVEYDVPANVSIAAREEEVVDLPDDLPAIPQSLHAFEHLQSDIAGPFEFKVVFRSDEDQHLDTSAKSTPWTYSSMTKRLFVSMGNPIPFTFTTAGDFPAGCAPMLRATPRYIQVEHRKQLITRCPHHQAQDNIGTTAPPSHVLRCRHIGASYRNDDGRLSVVIPYKEAASEAGERTCTLLYQLMCYSSCPGGLHRRPFEIVFTLEAHGRVLGSTSVDVRICACPGRDKKAAENRVLNKMQKGVGPRTEKVSKKELAPAARQHKGVLPTIAAGDAKVYSLCVVGRANYRLVRQVVQGLHVMCDFPADAGPDVPVEVPVPSAVAVKRVRKTEDIGGKGKAGAKKAKVAKGGQQPEVSALDMDTYLGGDTEPESEDEVAAEDKGAASPPRLRAVDVRFMQKGRLSNGVQQWLSVLGLQCYADSFIEVGYDDLDVIADLDPTDLDNLAVVKPGHRKKLLLAAANLNKHIAMSTPPSLGLQRSVSVLRRSFRADS